MRGLPTLIRLQRHRIDEIRRELAQAEAAAAAMHRAAERHEDEVRTQQVIATADPAYGFIYPAYARRAIAMREQFVAEIAAAEIIVTELRGRLAELYAELKRYEQTRDRRAARDRTEAERRETILLDDISLDMHRRQTEKMAG
jgi:flagellar biosynthesis chaperone FliJ